MVFGQWMGYQGWQMDLLGVKKYQWVGVQNFIVTRSTVLTEVDSKSRPNMMLSLH
jgi:ABC-type polysaccharide transport system permease subunit